MAAPLRTQLLAQIVSEDWRAASVFQKYGLDFCCRGRRSLDEACADKGLEPEAILAELTDLLVADAAAPDFSTFTINELTAYIVRVHHSYVKLQGPQVYGFVTTVASKHGDRFSYMPRVQELFSELLAELSEHMPKEEKGLFPKLQQLELTGASIEAADILALPIQLLEAEHRRCGEILAEMSALTNGYAAPEGSCNTHRIALQALKAFETDLHQHVHLENNVLFPKALAILAQQQSIPAEA